MFSMGDTQGMDVDPSGIPTERVTEGLANTAATSSGPSVANGPVGAAATSSDQSASIFRRNDNATLVTDVAMRMCDLKGVARPPQFSGKDLDWEEFRFRLESLAALLQLQEPMRRAAQASETDLVSLSDAWIPGAALLFNLLVQCCQGRALVILRMIRNSNGFLAWKRLVEEYEPTSTTRHNALLMELVSPKFHYIDTLDQDLMKSVRTGYRQQCLGFSQNCHSYSLGPTRASRVAQACSGNLEILCGFPYCFGSIPSTRKGARDWT